MGLGALVGKRVSLRAVRDEELAGIGAWIEEAATVAGIPHPRPLSRARERGERDSGVLVVERVGDENGPVGVVEYELNRGWLTVRFIALAKAYRGWGYGSEAVRLVEEWAVREGMAERFRAAVALRNGLGLYFWLRLGYRPVSREENEAWRVETLEHRMAMVREVA